MMDPASLVLLRALHQLLDILFSCIPGVNRGAGSRPYILRRLDDVANGATARIDHDRLFLVVVPNTLGARSVHSSHAVHSGVSTQTGS